MTMRCTERGAVLAVDNSFMSPRFQLPLELGADIVITPPPSSSTVTAIRLAAFWSLREPKDAEWFAFVQKSVGAILSPFDSFLVLRGLKTLAVRMDRHESSGRASPIFSMVTPR